MILSTAITIAKAAIQKSVGIKPSVVLKHEKLWETAQLRPEYRKFIDQVIDKVIDRKHRYETVANAMGNGMPWWAVMNWHIMEAGHKQNPFLFHLHCGDPLTARTVNVPRGRPKANPGNGSKPPSVTNPYTWEESALDCLINVCKFQSIKDWSIGNYLWISEKFNGLGYHNKKINTPYVWSYTNHYGEPPNIGKYVADSKFDPKAISKQAGCAAYILRMKERGIITV